MTAPFVDQAKASSRQADYNALRTAIRAWDSPDHIKKLWARCKRWTGQTGARDFRRPELAILVGNPQEIESAWDKCDRWI